jgi:alkanesulfonate monooxygenase SsuD/methylene tetrahydromethanopterin reductase-like flavin-dependent oxidoreductase (luciferase family)
MGTPMSERGARANDYLKAMIALWTMEHPRYSGRHVGFEGINAYPRPTQRPYPPFVVGGRAEGALRRTVRYAAGWYGYAMTVDQTRDLLDKLSEVRQKVQRPPELGDIEITIAPRETISAPTIAAYAEIGVSRLLVRPPQDQGLDAVEASIREFAHLT